MALLHKTRKSWSRYSSVEREALENLQSQWDFGDCERERDHRKGKRGKKHIVFGGGKILNLI